MHDRLIVLAPALCAAWGNLPKHQLGLAGESFAARALRRAAWQVIARRVRLPAGEIDLVLRHRPQAGQIENKAQETLVLMEIKSGIRPRQVCEPPRDGWSRSWRPGQHFTPTQFDSYRRARQQVRLRLPDLQHLPVRIDLLEVIFSSGSLTPILIHHRDLSSSPFAEEHAAPDHP